ncbi:hypothetical protein NPIL_692821, partial [Nephila pilipes]
RSSWVVVVRRVMHGVAGDETTVDGMIMDEGEKPPLSPQDICDAIEILIRQQKRLGARTDFLRQLANIVEVHYIFKDEKIIKELDNEMQGF